ncbi:hypothetical protein [Cytobacillus sp. Bac17]|uniref:hypothetical protein n=1 Tax=Cytobacillus sp. Bac17 TaxID=2926008 RepID=UPI0021198B0A|nr:hypothetical protein [Cytobacillus sp. Bac17]
MDSKLAHMLLAVLDYNIVRKLEHRKEFFLMHEKSRGNRQTFIGMDLNPIITGIS